MEENVETADMDQEEDDAKVGLVELLAEKQEYINWLQDSLINVSNAIKMLIDEFESDDYGPYISKSVVIEKLEEAWEEM